MNKNPYCELIVFNFWGSNCLSKTIGGGGLTVFFFTEMRGFSKSVLFPVECHELSEKRAHLENEKLQFFGKQKRATSWEYHISLTQFSFPVESYEVSEKRSNFKMRNVHPHTTVESHSFIFFQGCFLLFMWGQEGGVAVKYQQEAPHQLLFCQIEGVSLSLDNTTGRRAS